MKQRLVIFTGKGGVGKTTLALAYTKSLLNQNLKVKYNSFYQAPEENIVADVNVPLFKISIEESAEIYIANKLNSKTIAAWIMHTHFFKSLFQMIPGFGHMILLGHILKELENDPELIIVLDSPASGHALTMFESSSNFKKIFKTGLIVKDIEKMKSKLEDPDFLKTYIIALPNELAVTEASELIEELENIYTNNELIINNSFKLFCESNKIKEDSLPDFLLQKISAEKDIQSKLITLPHVPETDFVKVVNILSIEVKAIT
jgi:arsenite-transporting ATPase